MFIIFVLECMLLHVVQVVLLLDVVFLLVGLIINLYYSAQLNAKIKLNNVVAQKLIYRY